MLVSQIVSRIRDSIKEQFGDSRYSNRYLFSLFKTKAKTLISIDAGKGNLFKQNNSWKTICIDMEIASSIFCEEVCIPYDKYLYRSKCKLPKLMEASSGTLLKSLTTVDFSKNINLVSPTEFFVKKKIRFNTEKYAFIQNGYLFTNVSYPVLLLVSIPEEITYTNCEELSNVKTCNTALFGDFFIPAYLEEPVFQMCLQELMGTKQIQTDEAPNQNSLQIQGTP